MREYRRGFSLIELVISIGIAAGILFMVGTIASQLADIGNLVNSKLQNKQDIEISFEAMTTEIRSMKNSVLGAYPIESAATSSFIFFSDVDGDGIAERVRYFFNTSTVDKGITKASGSPLAYVTSTETLRTIIPSVVLSTSTNIFSYFDSNYTGTQNPMAYPIDISQIRIVKSDVSVDVNPGKPPGASNYSDLITVRNLKTN